MPQLGGNAGTGAGWLVVEGDESDRSIVRSCDPGIAVVTNVELDHHAAYGSEAELQASFDAWLAAMPDVVRGWELDPVDLRARRARRAQPPERRDGARRRSSARASTRRDAEAALARFAGVDRRFELVGDARRRAVIDDYGAQPDRDRARRSRRRATGPRAASSPLYLPHVVRADAPPPPRARRRARARGRRDRDRLSWAGGTRRERA